MVDTVLIIFEQACLYFPLVLGAYISISLLKMPDLSIEAAYVFGAIVGAKMLALTHGMPHIVVAIAVFTASILGGLFVGLISSSLTQLAGVPHLLSSILTIGLFHGINQFVLGTAIFSMSRFYNPLQSIHIFLRNPELPMLLILFLVLLVAGYFLLKTQLGYSFAVFGNNPHFFENYRISTNYVVMLGVVLSNGLAGLSGYFVAQSSGFVDVNAGFGIALFCVTSLILGKALCWFLRSFSIIMPVTGIIAFCIIQQTLLKVGFNLKYFTMIQSALVLVILVNKYRRMGKVKRTIDNLGV